MVRLVVMTAIFKSDFDCDDLVYSYASTAQSELSMDYLGEMSLHIALYAAYLRVLTSPEQTSQIINNSIVKYLATNNSINFHFNPDTRRAVSQDTLDAFRLILSNDPSAKWLFLNELEQEIIQYSTCGDSHFLISLDELKKIKY